MTNLEQQTSKAAAFRAMHSGNEILLLPNAWDVASARIIEDAGFGAIATTSGGIAFSLGYPDGQKIPREEMLAVVARIARAVKVPVTADVESGYGNSPEDAARTAHAVMEAGAVGMNLEDATGNLDHPLVELSLQLEKIRAVCEAASSRKIPLVLNARTEVYLLQVGEPAKRYDEALRRLRAFRDAGADCMFLPGLSDASTIGRMVSDLKGPLNILAGPGSPPVPELRKLGVARVSLGSSVARAALGVLRRVTDELRTSGTYESLAGAPSYAEMNKLVGAGAENENREPRTGFIGVISDTHGLLRPEALEALRGSRHIIHAGDVGAPEVLEKLAEIAPVTAIRGNIDRSEWARKLPGTEVLEIAGISIYILHDLKQLDLKPKAAGFDLVISGHSHVPAQERRGGVLYFNPGSAGPRRFKLPVSVARVMVREGRIVTELITLPVH
jgi:putative phosphoesterase